MPSRSTSCARSDCRRPTRRRCSATTRWRCSIWWRGKRRRSFDGSVDERSTLPMGVPPGGLVGAGPRGASGGWRTEDAVVQQYQPTTAEEIDEGAEASNMRLVGYHDL